MNTHVVTMTEERCHTRDIYQHTRQNKKEWEHLAVPGGYRSCLGKISILLCMTSQHGRDHRIKVYTLSMIKHHFSTLSLLFMLLVS